MSDRWFLSSMTDFSQIKIQMPILSVQMIVFPPLLIDSALISIMIFVIDVTLTGLC